MKQALRIITAAAMFPVMANAAEMTDVKLDGFLDIVWTLSDGTDEGVNGAEGHFDTSGEVDLKSKLKGPISLRMDADLNPAGGGDSGRLEQAHLIWDIQNNVSLKAGVFNNNLGWEKEDAPDMYQITHGQLYDLWNFGVPLLGINMEGHNLTGVEVAYNAGMFTVMGGYLNDLGDVPDENSIKLAAELRPMPALEVVVGLITQETFLEDILDVSATWHMDKKLTLGAELMLPDQFIDSGLMVVANYQFTNEFSGTARYDRVSYDISGYDDTTSITLAGLYAIDENLFANAEIRVNSDDNVATASSLLDVGEGDGDTVRLELLATF